MPKGRSMPVAVAGVTYASLRAASEELGIPSQTLSHRIKHQGLSPADALGLGRRTRGRAVFVAGMTYATRAAAARAHGLDPNVVRRRLQIGWTLERAVTTPQRRTSDADA